MAGQWWIKSVYPGSTVLADPIRVPLDFDVSQAVHEGRREWTALHWAASEGNKALCARLLLHDADPSQARFGLFFCCRLVA